MTIDLKDVLGPEVQLGAPPPGASLNGNLLTFPLPALEPGGAAQVSFSVNLSEKSGGTVLKPVISGIQIPPENRLTTLSGPDGNCIAGGVGGGSICSTSVTVKGKSPVDKGNGGGTGTGGMKPVLNKGMGPGTFLGGGWSSGGLAKTGINPQMVLITFIGLSFLVAGVLVVIVRYHSQRRLKYDKLTP